MENIFSGLLGSLSSLKIILKIEFCLSRARGVGGSRCCKSNFYSCTDPIKLSLIFSYFDVFLASKGSGNSEELVCVLFVLFLLFVVILSGEPRQKQGRGLVDPKLV